MLGHISILGVDIVSMHIWTSFLLIGIVFSFVEPKQYVISSAFPDFNQFLQFGITPMGPGYVLAASS